MHNRNREFPSDSTATQSHLLFRRVYSKYVAPGTLEAGEVRPLFPCSLLNMPGGRRAVLIALVPWIQRLLGCCVSRCRLQHKLATLEALGHIYVYGNVYGST